MKKMLSLFVPLVLLASPVWAADDALPRTIAVQGEGIVAARPDMAVIGAGVVTQDKTAAQALSANSKAVEQLIGVLDRVDVDDRDIRTAGVNVSPVFDRPRDGSAPKITGYRVENRLSIRVRDLDKTGELLDALVQAGANQISGPNLTFADPGKLRDEARKLAVQDAKRRAALYAEELDVDVGPVLSLSEASIQVAPRPMLAVSEKAMARDVPIAAGEQEVRANISAVFEID